MPVISLKSERNRLFDRKIFLARYSTCIFSGCVVAIICLIRKILLSVSLIVYFPTRLFNNLRITFSNKIGWRLMIASCKSPGLKILNMLASKGYISVPDRNLFFINLAIGEFGSK